MRTLVGNGDGAVAEIGEASEIDSGDEPATVFLPPTEPIDILEVIRRLGGPTG
jgi:hypothetical protein